MGTAEFCYTVKEKGGRSARMKKEEFACAYVLYSMIPTTSKQSSQHVLAIENSTEIDVKSLQRERIETRLVEVFWKVE